MDPNSAEIRKLNEFLNRIKRRVQPNKQLMTKLAGIMHAGVEQNFEDEGRPKWPKLAKSTIRDRQRKGYWPGKILQREGFLVRSIIPRATKTQSIVATNEIYAKVHQFGHTFNRAARSEIIVRNRYKRAPKKGRFKKGTTRGKGFTFKSYSYTVPARPFMLFRDPEVEQIITAVKEHILN